MRFFTALLISLLLALPGFSQTQVKGKVSDKQTGNSISAAVVMLGQIQVLSGDDGGFSFAVEQGSYQIVISAEGYQFHTATVLVGEVPVDLGDIKLTRRFSLQAEATGIAEVSLGSGDFESSRESQSISGLLQASSDVFVNISGFTFSSMRYRMRGMDSEYYDVYISGMLMNDMENGRPTWSEWGGLNDALRNREELNGITAGSFGFGNVGGANNMVTRASLQRKQHKVTYALSNRSYNNRITYTYSTGMLPNNWAFSVNASRRWAQEGMVEGTFYDAYAYFLGIERKLNARHSLALSVLGSPYRRGMQGPSVQEVYDLKDNNQYNPNWGWQEGSKRNARVRTAHEPKAILNHFWNAGNKTQITNTLGVSFGRYGTTALNWYDAPDPRPDYYRYLPSYQLEESTKDKYTAAWQNDAEGELTQINWNKIYQINYIANALGQQAKYMIEDRRDDHLRFFGSSNVRHQINDNIHLNTGLELQSYTGYHFKTLDDLLGGEYWTDVDQFAERDFSGDTTKLNNDLENPGKVVKEGDRFGYEYHMRLNSAKLWSVAQYRSRKVDGWLGAHITGTTFWREGMLKNGRYPELSKGKSEVFNYTNFGFKTGWTYKITGRHYLIGNAAYMTRAPYLTNVYTAPRISNKTITDPKSETNISGDINYVHKGIRTNIRATAYQTWLKDQTDVMGFYHDDFRTFVILVMTGIDKVHQGFELGADVKLSKTLTAVAAAGIGNYVYTSRPQAVATFENGSRPDTVRTVYSKYFFVGGTPQTAASLGLKYAHPKYWFVDLNLNYFDRIYLDFNPERRTQRAIENLGPGDPKIDEIIAQEQLPSGFTLDFSLGKSWRYKDYYIGLNLNVSNVFNNTELKTGGFEQMRFDFEGKNLDKFPPKYFYNYGRTFFLMFSLRF
jgi:hypothetical protein